jgi:hypothetical protein
LFVRSYIHLSFKIIGKLQNGSLNIRWVVLGG